MLVTLSFRCNFEKESTSKFPISPLQVGFAVRFPSEKLSVNCPNTRFDCSRMIKVKMDFFIIGKYSIFGK